MWRAIVKALIEALLPIVIKELEEEKAPEAKALSISKPDYTVIAKNRIMDSVFEAMHSNEQD